MSCTDEVFGKGEAGTYADVFPPSANRAAEVTSLVAIDNVPTNEPARNPQRNKTGTQPGKEPAAGSRSAAGC
jgi:hypothetical protein